MVTVYVWKRVRWDEPQLQCAWHGKRGLKVGFKHKGRSPTQGQKDKKQREEKV